MNSLSTGQLKQIAKEKLKGNWGVVLGCMIVVAFLTSLASSIFGIGELIVIGPFSVGLGLVLLNVFRNGKADFEDLFTGFTRNFFNNLVVGLCVYVFTALWSLLFVIPGIVKSYAYAMTFYIQNDHPEMSETDAITASRKMMKGNKMDLFLLDLSFIGWYILVCLTFGLLLLYVGPYHKAARTAFYEQLKAQQEGTVEQAAQPQDAPVAEEPIVAEETSAVEELAAIEAPQEDVQAPQEDEDKE